jgi:hypothetical protein
VTAQHPHRVFPLNLGRGVHQPVGQFAIVGQQQQALRIQVKPSHRDPAAIIATAADVRKPWADRRDHDGLVISPTGL